MSAVLKIERDSLMINLDETVLPEYFNEIEESSGEFGLQATYSPQYEGNEVVYFQYNNGQFVVLGTSIIENGVASLVIERSGFGSKAGSGSGIDMSDVYTIVLRDGRGRP